MIKEIKQFNNKGQYHGYQQWYWLDKLELRVKYNHGFEIGYEEWHIYKQTKYYIR